jgi:hypothetical protein
MARERLTFRQRDVAAAIRAVKRAGLAVAQIKITPEGEIIVITGSGEIVEPKKNSWDELYENPPKLR